MKKTLLLIAGIAMATSAMATSHLTMPAQPVAPVKVAATPLKATVSTNVTVKESKTVKTFANGYSLELMRLNNGQVQCVLVKDGQMPVSATAVKPTTKLVKAAALTLDESFEGWDHEAYDWIPEGWQDVSKVDPPNVAPGPDDYPNLTWETCYNGWSAPSHSGEAEAIMQYSYEWLEEEHPVYRKPQDEWLISPSVPVVVGDCLAFYLSYSPGWTRWNTEKEEEYFGGNYNLDMFDGKTCDFEVLVSTDGGNEWTKVWDCMEDAKNYTRDELNYDTQLMVHPYVPVIINMDQFAGQNIMFALRFAATNAYASMLVDDIMLGQLTPEAAYTSPSTLFNIGMSTAWTIARPENMYKLGPAFAEYTWTNKSNLAFAYEWEYSDAADTESTLTSTDKDLTTPEYIGGTVSMLPVLNAKLDSKVSTFQGAYAGVFNGGDFDFHDGSGVYLGVGKYDPNLVAAGQLTDIGVLGCGKIFDERWDYMMFGEREEGEDIVAKVKGLGCSYEAPAAPYLLSYVYFNLVSYQLSDGATIKANVWPLDAYGRVGSEPLAYGEVSAAEIITDEDGFATVFMPLVQTIDDLEYEMPITVDGPIYVEFSLENGANEDYFSMLCVMGRADEVSESDTSMARVFNGRYYSTYKFASLGFEDGSVFQGLIMSLGITYNWLYEINNTYNNLGISADGGDAKFTLNSYFDGTDFWEITADGLNEYVTYTLGEFDPATGNQDITFHMDALPEGEKDRYSVIKIVCPGAIDQIFYIGQKAESGVESIGGSSNRARCQGGNFVVESATATAVKVFDVAGRCVASAQFSGSAVITADNLPKGIYVLKFNDNTVVKLMK